MMQDESSFDKVYKDRMFLDKAPARKWWPFSRTTADDRPSYVAPNYTHEISLIQDNTQEDDERQLLLLEGGMVELEPEQTILTERHGDIREINSSIKQINQIQKDLAIVVESQSEEVASLRTLSIESLDNTTRGINHLVHIQSSLAARSRRRKRALALGSGILLVGYTAHRIMDRFVEDASVDNEH